MVRWPLWIVMSVCASRTLADVLVFDDLGLPDHAGVTDQYAARGVIFSAPGGQSLITTATYPLFPDDPQGLYSSVGLYGFEGPIVVDFLIAAESAGAWVDFGDPPGGVALRIEAFDGPGGTGQLLATAWTAEQEFLGVAASGIRSVVFTEYDVDDFTTYMIDHFTFQLVPAPGTAAVAFALAFCSGIYRRDRRAGSAVPR